jgi:hypothetical protein
VGRSSLARVLVSSSEVALTLKCQTRAVAAPVLLFTKGSRPQKTVRSRILCRSLDVTLLPASAIWRFACLLTSLTSCMN